MLESFRIFLANNFFSTLQGASAGDWWRELKRNHFSISPRYWGRAAVISASCPVNSLFARRVRKLTNAEFAAVEVQSPLFILGHWRSGTTLLQRLFALDDRFAYPSFYECVFPRGFISSEKLNSKRYSAALPTNRLFDNMSNGFDSPAEDEFALSVLTGMSPYMGWCFPRNRAAYAKYLTFDEATPDEIARWKEGFNLFTKYLTLYHRKPLVLKSPPHTARVRRLLELFPDAKFIHICRNPYTVFSSTKKMLTTFEKTTRLQTWDRALLDEEILRNYQLMHDALIRDLPSIRPDRFVEIRFEDLEREPVESMRAAYQALSLPDFGRVEPAVRRHLDEQKDYRKNRHDPLPESVRSAIADRWRLYLDRWNYEDPSTRRELSDAEPSPEERNRAERPAETPTTA